MHINEKWAVELSILPLAREVGETVKKVSFTKTNVN